jgi:AraC-like DNA-binding protein
MYFTRINPSAVLGPYVECYWFIDSDDPEQHQQKIIPDGFTEIIFHLGDPYRINLSGEWEMQAKVLIAGQISKYFFLENTGRSKVVGIKFTPAGLTHLFGLQMNALTDKVLPFGAVKLFFLQQLQEQLHKGLNQDEIVVLVEKSLQAFINPKPDERIDKAIGQVLQTNGTVPIAELCKSLFVNERQLQRLFQKYIGLSPKFYARIIRFNYIFQLLEKGHNSWTEISYHSGYFDQSHFIRDFKAFTGEDPSRYFFDEANMANFFLKRSSEQ